MLESTVIKDSAHQQRIRTFKTSAAKKFLSTVRMPRPGSKKEFTGVWRSKESRVAGEGAGTGASSRVAATAGSNWSMATSKFYKRGKEREREREV